MNFLGKLFSLGRKLSDNIPGIGKISHYAPKIRKMPARGLYGNQEFQVPSSPSFI